MAVDGRNTKEQIDAFWSKYHAQSHPLYEAAISKGKDNDFALLDSTVPIPGVGQGDLQSIQRWWNEELVALNPPKPKSYGGQFKGGGGGGGGGGGTKNVPQKKPEPPPPPTATVVSFGKLFSSFCLPGLTAAAEEQGIDEVQVNFYQMNESCGPISLHSIAEFPIEIDYAESKFALIAATRGGESMTIFEFISWCSEYLFSDRRSPGYGMREIYEPETTDAEQPKEKDEANDTKKDTKQQEYFTKYGVFKMPILAMKIDILYEGDNNRIDLLYKLQYRVGAQYNAPPPRFDAASPTKKIKRIMRVDLFDRTYNPYTRTAKILQDENGRYRTFESDVSSGEAQEFATKYAQEHQRDYAQPAAAPSVTVSPSSQSNRTTYRLANDKDVTVGPPFASGKNVLKEYLGESIPKISVGINSTMVTNASFSSQISGLAGTISMKNIFSKSTLAPNALMSSENNLPVKVTPGELTLNTVGCPLADIMQSFFIDFETGTTLDAIYKVKQVQHNFVAGKFETAWTMQHFESYSTFFGAASVDSALKELHKDTTEKKERDENSDQPQSDPPPNVTAAQMNTSAGNA